MKNLLQRKPQELPQKLIDEIKIVNWVVQDGVGTPFLSWYAEVAFVDGLEKLGFGPKRLITFFKNGILQWRFDNDRMIYCAKRLIKDELNNKYTARKFYRQWQQKEKFFIKSWQKTKNELKNFPKGKILVAKSTQPNYLPAMQRAKAFITDEGGLLCHAAIVSRELGIPCIIGTKNATHVLKDGDMVEVDANEGIVRKLDTQSKLNVQ